VDHQDRCKQRPKEYRRFKRETFNNQKEKVDAKKNSNIRSISISYHTKPTTTLKGSTKTYSSYKGSTPKQVAKREP
jgi:hypothetical protein